MRAEVQVAADGRKGLGVRWGGGGVRGGVREGWEELSRILILLVLIRLTS